MNNSPFSTRCRWAARQQEDDCCITVVARPYKAGKRRASRHILNQFHQSVSQESAQESVSWPETGSQRLKIITAHLDRLGGRRDRDSNASHRVGAHAFTSDDT
jgi:hypothetical protein